jgi:hypothetical protein
MHTDLNHPVFDKALLTGVFTGFATTVICLIFNVVYRDYSGFTLSAIINVSSLIFALNILFVIIGLLFFFFLRTFKKGTPVYITVFILLTLFCLWKTMSIQRSADLSVSAEFRGLLTGIILIAGIASAFGIPLLYHSKGFEKHVL